MFGELTAAFGLTVLCLMPLMIVTLVIPPFLMRFTRPKPADGGSPPKRNPVTAAMVYARLYFMALIVMVMLTIAFWWGFLLLTDDTNAVIDFASQSLPVEREQIENAVEPVITPTVP